MERPERRIRRRRPQLDKTNFDATNLRPNGRYQFAVYSRNQAGDSTHVDSPVIYTTPRAPVKVEAVKTGAKSAQILIDLSGSYANGFDIQRRLAGGDWQDLATGGYAGKPAQVLDDDTPTGIVEYRARARRPIYGDDASKGVLTGDWTQSNQITTICPPAAPTITSPTQGTTLATPLTLDIRLRRTILTDPARPPRKSNSPTRPVPSQPQPPPRPPHTGSRPARTDDGRSASAPKACTPTGANGANQPPSARRHHQTSPSPTRPPSPPAHSTSHGRSPTPPASHTSASASARTEPSSTRPTSTAASEA